MKKIIINLDDIRETKEYFSLSPKHFISFFIYLLFVVLIICIILSVIIKIDEVVLSNGEIRPSDSIGTVASTVGGRIKKIYYSNGQSVEKGEKLIELEDEDLQIILHNLNKNMQDETVKLENVEKYINGIERETNPFNKDDRTQYNSYMKFEDYLLQLKKTKITSEQDITENDSNIDYYNKQLVFLNNKLNNYNLLKKAIEEDDDSCLNGNPECQTMYKQYLYSIRLIDTEYDEKINNYDVDISIQSNKDSKEYYKSLVDDYSLLIKSINNNKSEFDDNTNSVAKHLFDEYILTYESYNKNIEKEANEAKIYKNKKLSEYRSTIAKYEEQMSELKYESKELKKRANNMDIIEENYENSISNTYYNKINELNDVIKQLNDEITEYNIKKNNSELKKRMYNNAIDEDGQHIVVKEIMINEMNLYLSKQETIKKAIVDLENEIQKVNNDIDSTIIISNVCGLINENHHINEGDVIEAGTILATIVPESNDEYKVITYIKNNDIGKIDTGNYVKFEISALPLNNYGLCSGRIEYISNDVINDENHAGCYYVECSIDQNKLLNQKGEERKLIVGMETNCKIITSQKSIARFLFEKLLNN